MYFRRQPRNLETAVSASFLELPPRRFGPDYLRTSVRSVLSFSGSSPIRVSLRRRGMILIRAPAALSVTVGSRFNDARELRRPRRRKAIKLSLDNGG